MTAIYPGATAEDVAQAVAAPIEQQLSGLDGLLYYRRPTRATASMNLQVYFDIAPRPGPRRGGRAERGQAGRAAAARGGAATRHHDPQGATPTSCCVAALTSDDPRYDAAYLTNYLKLYVEDEIKRVPGVGDATVFGGLDFSMLHPARPRPDGAARHHGGRRARRGAGAERHQPGGPLGREPAPPGTELTLPVTTLGPAHRPPSSSTTSSSGRGPTARSCGCATSARSSSASQSYDLVGRLNGQPTAQHRCSTSRPGANALAGEEGGRRRGWTSWPRRFPPGVSCDDPVRHDAVRHRVDRGGRR